MELHEKSELRDHCRIGAERADRAIADLDLGDSLLGAIAPDAEVARRAGRVLAAFYIPSMPPALLERHGIGPEDVKPISDAFADGNVRRALELTPDDVADRLMLAGTPDDWIQWLNDTYAPAGLDHALVSFTDPFTLEAWAVARVDGLPSLFEQVRLVGEEVLPAVVSSPHEVGPSDAEGLSNREACSLDDPCVVARKRIGPGLRLPLRRTTQACPRLRFAWKRTSPLSLARTSRQGGSGGSGRRRR